VDKMSAHIASAGTVENFVGNV